MSRLAHRLILACLALMVAALACTLPGQKPPVTPQNTPDVLSGTQTSAVERTRSAIRTQRALDLARLDTPTAVRNTVRPSPTPGPSQTPVPQGTSNVTPVVSACDHYSLVRDVTIPDGTFMVKNTKFTKTWRLKNTGTCTWMMDYEIYFESGDAMVGPNSVRIKRNVLPGETIDVSIDLTAPDHIGLFRSNYKMRNSNGEIFGSTNDNKPFYVEIWVGNSGQFNLRFDLTGYFCEAEWSVDGRPIPCHNPDDDPTGFARIVGEPILENNSKDDEDALLTVPAYETDSVIRGRYPELKILRGDHFTSVVGCEYGYTRCNVTFSLDYQVGDEGPIQNYAHWNVAYDGELTVLDISLSELAGQTVHLILSVTAHNDSGQNRAQWLRPRIMYIPTLGETPVPSATP